MKSSDEPLWINGEQIGDLPFHYRARAPRDVWMLDNKRNGFYIPRSNDRLVVRRSKQKWTYIFNRYLRDPSNNPGTIAKGDKRFVETKDASAELERYYRPTQGDFSLAYLDHGNAPQNRSYEYATLVATTPDEMREFARGMNDLKNAPYSVRQADDNAHILYDRDAEIWGYVLFEAGDRGAYPGPLIGNSRPCYAMLKKNGEGYLVSVSSSDLSQSEPIRVVLRDRLSFARNNERYRVVEQPAGGTTLEFDYRDYTPILAEVVRE